MGIKIHKIIKSRRKTLGIEIDKNAQVIIRAPLFLTDKKIIELVNKKSLWISKKQVFRNKQKRLKKKFLKTKTKAYKKDHIENTIIKEVKKLAIKYKFSYNRITIKNTRTIWGSCSATNNLTFSKNIFLLPEKAMKYIIVHELAHTIEKNHSRNFWKIVAKIIPQYKKIRAWLRLHSYIIDV